MTSKKDGFENSRTATADYEINDPVKAFKILVSMRQGTSLEKEIEQLRREI